MPQSQSNAVAPAAPEMVRRMIVVDGLAETAQVLHAVFAPRGHQVERRRGYENLLAADDAPSLIIVHDDGSGTACRQPVATGPQIIIARRGDTVAPLPAAERRLSQPFQYSDLIAAVESLLADTAPERAAA